MSSFLYRLGRLCFKRRKRVLGVWITIVAIFGIGVLLSPRVFDDTFTIPGAASQIALERLKITFPQAADASAQVIITSPEGTRLDDPSVQVRIEEYFTAVERLDFVKGVTSPYLEQAEGQITPDGRYALASVRVYGMNFDFTDAHRVELRQNVEKISEYLPGATANIGGNIYAVNMPELGITEAMGLVVAIIVLFLALGSALGAVVPVATALTGVGLGAAIVVLDASLMSVNAVTLILTVMLGLAVGIDYALFIVSRHRDQLATGQDLEESVARAVGTAGSAVIFAGLTVVIALIGLSLANLPFLTIMGCLSALTVVIAVCLALTLLPALLGFFGEHLRPKARQPKQPIRWHPAEFWVKTTTKAPWLVCAIVLVGLGALSFPTTQMELSLPNSGLSEPGKLDRVTFDMISEHFGVGYNGPLVVTADIVESDDPEKIINGMKADILAMPGVELISVATPNPNVDTAMFQVIPTTAPDSPKTTELVHQLTSMAPEWKSRYSVDTSVTGFTAASIDITDRLRDAMLPFLLFVVGLSFLLLMMVFRSIWVPLKAALGYLLSVGGAFGATTLLFNEGWYMWIVNLPETRPVISFLPIFGMGILFGLAMDYEVFLTSRMREEYVHGNPNYIVDGFTHSSKVVVSAAIIMFGVFAFFVPASSGMVKPIAFCLAVGVALDAFLIRMTLGPAIMRLLGERAWWLPGWLDRILPTLDIEGESLSRQLNVRKAFADFPEPVVATELSAENEGEILFSGLELMVPEGEVVVVSGAPAARKALFYGLSGRVPLTSGKGVIAGGVLGEESSVIRSKTLLLEAVSDFAAALPKKAQVVFVDQVDELDAEQRRYLQEKYLLTPAAWIFGVSQGVAAESIIRKPYFVINLDEHRLDATAVGMEQQYG